MHGGLSDVTPHTQDPLHLTGRRHQSCDDKKSNVSPVAFEDRGKTEAACPITAAQTDVASGTHAPAPFRVIVNSEKELRFVLVDPVGLGSEEAKEEDLGIGKVGGGVGDDDVDEGEPFVYLPKHGFEVGVGDEDEDEGGDDDVEYSMSTVSASSCEDEGDSSGPVDWTLLTKSWGLAGDGPIQSENAQPDSSSVSAGSRGLVVDEAHVPSVVPPLNMANSVNIPTGRPGSGNAVNVPPSGVGSPVEANLRVGTSLLPGVDDEDDSEGEDIEESL